MDRVRFVRVAALALAVHLGTFPCPSSAAPKDGRAAERSPGAAEARHRVLLDDAALGPKWWESDPSVGVAAEGGVTTFRLKGKPYAWAAMRERIAIDADSTISVAPVEAAGGAAHVQVEWFDTAGRLVEPPAPLLSRADARKGLRDKRLADLFPAGERPAAMRLKLWLEGDGASAGLRGVIVRSPRRWREPNVRVVHLYGPDSATEADPGTDTHVVGASLVLKLDGTRKQGACTLTDRVAYQPGGVVKVDLGAVDGGGVSLQALCWDKRGKLLSSVDVLKNITAPGSFEVPLRLHADQFPAGTEQLSFKLWLGGGPSARARLIALLYGVCKRD